MTLGELLKGKKVRATKDCTGAEKGKIYEIEGDEPSYLTLKGTQCSCSGTWELIDSIIYKPSPHKHKIQKVCTECGQEVK